MTPLKRSILSLKSLEVETVISQTVTRGPFSPSIGPPIHRSHVSLYHKDNNSQSSKGRCFSPLPPVLAVYLELKALTCVESLETLF
jgi:hypothetical protein